MFPCYHITPLPPPSLVEVEIDISIVLGPHGGRHSGDGTPVWARKRREYLWLPEAHPMQRIFKAAKGRSHSQVAVICISSRLAPIHDRSYCGMQHHQSPGARIQKPIVRENDQVSQNIIHNPIACPEQYLFSLKLLSGNTLLRRT